MAVVFNHKHDVQRSQINGHNYSILCRFEWFKSLELVSQINAIQCRELRSILSAISFASVVYSRSYEKENEVEIENGNGNENENKIEDRTSFEMRSRPQTEDI